MKQNATYAKNILSLDSDTDVLNASITICVR